MLQADRSATVIGISGPSCAGKTWLAGLVHQHLAAESVLIDLDGYYRDLDEVAGLEHGHDNPQSVDFDRALLDLGALKRGQAVQLPVYCYETHRVKSYRHCPPRPVIVLEGLFVFAEPRLREEVDLKIWVEAEDRLLLERRIERDGTQRVRTIDEIHQRYEQDVIPGFDKFIRPLRAHADLIVTNDGRSATMTPELVNQVLNHIDLVTGQRTGPR